MPLSLSLGLIKPESLYPATVQPRMNRPNTGTTMKTDQRPGRFPLTTAQLRHLVAWPKGSLVVLCIILLAGCSSVPPAPSLAAKPIAAREATNIDSPGSTVRALRAQHSEWAGTPYRFGGMSKSGVDCSGFVWNTFAHRFGLDLPRTTDGQKQVGYVVERDQLAPGDLLFFQTGYGKLHSGIYVEDGVFLHASSSRGVMFSDLSNPYWRENYWHARRVR